jgi:hypothetical protein
MQKLVVIPAEQLETIVIDAVVAAFKYHYKPAATAIDKGDELPELMTRRQVAEYLAVTVQSIDNFTRQGLLRKHYINGLPRFKREEVRAAAAAYERYSRD